jgi:hypothetical protein
MTGHAETDAGRFTKTLGGIVGKTLKHAKLIAAEGGDGIQPVGQTA